MATDAPDGTKLVAGECCETLRGVLEADDYEPLFSLEENGAIYITVGLGDSEEDGAGLLDHVMSYCPFCGTKQPEASDAETEVKLS